MKFFIMISQLTWNGKVCKLFVHAFCAGKLTAPGRQSVKYQSFCVVESSWYVRMP